MLEGTGVMTLPYRTNDGWVCGGCGTWVPNGVSHTCPTKSDYSSATPVNFTYVPYQDLLSELKRIADALEKIERKLG
jgi:hypothetical protein